MAFYNRIHNVAKAEFTGLSGAKERLGIKTESWNFGIRFGHRRWASAPDLNFGKAAAGPY